MKKATSTKKPSIEEVIKSFAVEGYILLTTTYKNNRTKLNYICNNGHEHNISWKEWNNLGNRCPYCSMKIKKTREEVERAFAAEGYVLLTKKYKNSTQYLYYICPKGHVHKITRINWLNGNRCPYCAEQIKPNIEQVRMAFAKEGYKLLSTKYINNKQKLEYICPVGHSHTISWNKWKTGRRCRECSYIKRGIAQTGSNSPVWKGGISYAPYCQIWADKEYKQSIRNRDKNICQNPYCFKTTNKLVIHHIDYDKKNCHPSNLITVCNSCNLRANTNRAWHADWYKTIISNRFGCTHKEN